MAKINFKDFAREYKILYVVETKILLKYWKETLILCGISIALIEVVFDIIEQKKLKKEFIKPYEKRKRI